MPDGSNDHPTIEEGGKAGRGHIGLIVLSSIAVGLALGLVLDVLLFGGSRETMITGFALLSLAVGCAMLAELSARCTDCLLYTSPSPRDRQKSRMPSSA